MAPVSPSTGTRIRESLSAIYALFAAPRPGVIEGCPCCIGRRGVDVLLSKPLRDLSSDELWPYVSGAFLTIGGERDFRYLLPRILELSLSGRGLLDIEVVLGKLRLALWARWPREERQAIETLIDAWFDQALAHDVAEAQEWRVPWDTQAVLCGAACADLDLSPWLARLSAPSALPVRALLAEHFAKPLAQGSTPNGFWEDAPDGWRALAQVLAAD